ncbi:DNA translocase FtsK [Turneriella parva]|uniref:Cell division FtsK/SpoIIIE n=1 Tax=Turneriella parva (strain ATCC BAA-1111 / DSM 21527 / NCTC 11395 / H) TaxID=869212 RepID=I4B0R6_TURPD|nr:DNA translocase FtsK [Turneriella parva]AFM10873.1 cell division FtsK/SpoIIIE [Turneriella parva DSM 21527]
MLKWLKNTEKSSSVEIKGEARPPWIQKIRVPVPDKPEPELQWKSRLAEKLGEMRHTESAPKPTRVAQLDGYAFHIAPLDIAAANIMPETTAEADLPRTPAHDDRPPQRVAVGPVAAPTEYAYTLDAPRPKAQQPGEYNLSYSTLDYAGGDEFDLERLFDAADFEVSRPWSAPDAAIDALDPLLQGARVAVAPAEDTAEIITMDIAADGQDESFEELLEKSEPVAPPAKPAASAEADGKASVRLKAEALIKREAAPKPMPAVIDRASVTPQVHVSRQREILFPLLKTQRHALEFSNPAEAQNVIAKLEETLDQFSIEGRVIGIQRGPIITRYELKMAAGIKVNRILALTDELAMALEAMRVRIEAPIPGRSTVGIEIPNKQRVKVLLGDILNDIGYKEFGGELPLPLGRDIAGNLLLEDLTRMPHLLIAGATGSGKSVAVNSFISSLILHKTPEEVRFLLVDPKLVELSGYNDIPHLLHPVITEPNKAILALNWAVEEMERRYEDLADMSTRDIRSYNEKVRTQRGKNKNIGEETPIMPYIVVLIDELGDLMMVAGKEVESSIIRLAQKARAVGIHLILATQRPSVDVITALIKANCPARIALQVAQKTDSRTILDGNGAEQLLGQGDMLFRHPSKAQLIRAQVPLIEDNEVEDVVAYAKKLAKPVYITLEDPKGKMGELEAGDEELFEEAWQIIVESQKASASYLQRRLRIGYNKAARLIEAFEARGMIGPQIGSKPREIIGTGQGGPGRAL